MMLAIGLGKTAIIGALLSFTPVFLVPMSAFIEKTRLDWRIFAGTVVAIAGVVLVSL
jgi:drug/metabolite transporter (DMT)-like permease